jgi:ribosomal protein L14E/L6E/L27E
MDNAELIHYGVKGMKWGVRRTPVQLGHRRKPKKIAKRSRESPESEKKKSAPKKSVHELSDEELRQAIGRLEMEKRYKELERSANPQKNNDGKKFVENILRKSGENIATQFTTYAMGTLVNKIAGSEIVNPKKGQKDK